MTTRFTVAELWVGVARSARPADEREDQKPKGGASLASCLIVPHGYREP